jgi:glucose-6-phosphate isomerase
MALQQSIDLALAASIGASGLPATALEAAKAGVETAARRLREENDAGRLPLLDLPGVTDDLSAIGSAAEELRRDATDVVILGTGGSSLGGQTLAQLRDYAVPGVGRFAGEPRVHFLDNLDPLTFGAVLERLPLETSRFVAISKSGGTGETLMQAIAVLAALDRAGLRDRASRSMLGISEPERGGKPNGLRRLLEPEGVRFLDHHTGVGGRYSVLTNVGLLPAAVLGLDLSAIRRGAADALAPVREGSAEAPAALGAAVNVAAAMEGKAIRGADGLRGPLRAADPLVGAALGGKPRQGRQGLPARGGDRPRRPAQPAAALSRRAERQAVHGAHDRCRRARARP